MKKMATFVLLNCTLIAAPIQVNWTNGTNDSLYSDSGNWSSGSVPDNSNEAIFPIPVTDPTNNLVFVDGNFTINSWLFPSSGTLDYVFTPDTNDRVLHFQSTDSGDLPRIDVLAGNQTFTGDPHDSVHGFIDTRPLNDFTINVASGASFTELGNNYIEPDDSVRFAIDLTIGGGGTLNLLENAQLFDWNTVNIRDIALVINDSTINENTTINQFDGSTVSNISGGFVGSLTSYNLMGGDFTNHSAFREITTYTQTGGFFINEDDGDIEFFSALNIDGGVFENFGTMGGIASLTLNDGTFLNDIKLTSDIGNFTVNGGTYEIGVINETDRGFILAETINLNGGLLVVDPLPGFNLFHGEQVIILESNFGTSGEFAAARTTKPGLEVEVIYDPFLTSIFFIPEAPPAIGELQQPILSSIDHINFRIERELYKVRERFCCDCRTNLIGGLVGSTGKIDRKGNRAGFDYYSVGGFVGADVAKSNYGFGGLINYEYVKSDFHNVWNNVRIDHLHGDLFGTYVPLTNPNFAFEAIVGLGYEWWDSQRTPIGAGRVVHGDSHSWEWDFLFGIEYLLQWSACISTEPYATIQYVKFDFERFREHDSFFNFDFRLRNDESLRSVLGVRLIGDYNFCDLFYFIPEIDIGWERENLDNAERLAFVPQINTSFPTTVRTEGIDRNILLVGVDLFFGFNCFGVEASYDLEWNRSFHNHYFFAGGNYKF